MEAKLLGKRNKPKSRSGGGAESKYFKDDKNHSKSCAPNSTVAVDVINQSVSSSLNTTVDSQAKAQTRLTYEFYNDTGVNLAKALLGQKLMRKLDSGEVIGGIIVETEAYMGLEDKAAHSYNGRRTEKTEAMFMAPGTVYVYYIYGMYCCMNISSQGEGCAVLLRALDPCNGIETIRQNRGQTDKKTKDFQLCNGPSKLCMGLDITKVSLNKQDLCNSDQIWLERGEDVADENIITGSRINIGYAGDWKDKPFRFYILGNKAVSVKDKEAEKELLKSSSDK